MDASRNDDELARVQSTDGKHARIALVETGQVITPIGPVIYRSNVGSNYLVLCFSSVWDPRLFHEFSDTDACLVIHSVEEFCERIHAAAEVQLPRWVGIDGAATYGARSPLGAVFSKPLRFFPQQEWRFAWLPDPPGRIVKPTLLTIGNIESLAEVRLKSNPRGPGNPYTNQSIDVGDLPIRRRRLCY
jgi:hypothetical protein